MKTLHLPSHVSSLALSQRLKELGVPQNSLFTWVDFEDPMTSQKELYLSYEHSPDSGHTAFELQFSAFLVSELGMMLWNAFERTSWDLLYKSYGEVFNFKGTQRIGELGIVNLMRKPDMAAKMLIYLLESHLITLEQMV